MDPSHTRYGAGITLNADRATFSALDRNTSRYIVIYCSRARAWSSRGQVEADTGQKGGEMYGRGRGSRPGLRGGYGLPSPAVGLAVGVAIFFLVVAAASSDFFPFFLFFWWMIPFVLVPAIGGSARGIVGLFEDRSRRVVDGDLKEKELLGALDRHGELTAARAALETSLSVSEADRMLSELAKRGHVEVRAREGRLGYALWEHDRRELAS